MTLIRPTQFPSLTAIAAPESIGKKNEVSLSLPYNLPEDFLLLGWASLLTSHVDEDEVYFFLDERGVSVNSHDRTVTRDVLLQKGLKYTTSVTTDTSSNQDVHFFLSLTYGDNGHDSRLVGSDLLHKDYLSELALQFRITLQRISTPVDTSKPDATNSAPRLSILNGHPQIIPGPQLLHDVVGGSNSKEKIAIDFAAGDGSRCNYTYAAIHESANKFANRLSGFLHAPAQPTGSSTLVVPLLIPQVPELYIALLGILKAGAAFCPLNLDAPAERIKFVAKDVKASVIVTTSAFKTQVPSIPGLAIWVMDEDADETITWQHHSRKATPLDLAYVLYSMFD